MTAKNDITGDSIKTRPSTDSYRDSWERIYGAKKATQVCEQGKEEDKAPQERAE